MTELAALAMVYQTELIGHAVDAEDALDRRRIAFRPDWRAATGPTGNGDGPGRPAGSGRRRPCRPCRPASTVAPDRPGAQMMPDPYQDPGAVDRPAGADATTSGETVRVVHVNDRFPGAVSIGRQHG